MAKVRVKMNSAGAQAILNSPGVQADLLARAQAVQAVANSFIGDGEGFVADVQSGKNRAHAMVRTSDVVSRRANAKQNVLLSSLDAGR
ncbi:hypothetical protein [Timonella senegalensis]|uniref:hypothetical protein n=1 Tax=Timonella senegalensis TaxID=1465825 RepID=UPI0002EEBC15|nr:hypothetical protein [Timonella senegalensis]